MQDAIEFIQTFPIVTFDKDQVMMSEGDTSDTLLVIASGFAKVTAYYGDGNEQMLWIVGRLDIAPTEQLFYKTAALAYTYIALSPVVAYKIPKVDFLAYADQTPVLMKEVARGLSNHYDDLLFRLSSITQASAREKLIYTLQNIASRFSAEDSIDLFEIGLNITHKDIAQLIHSSRETASIELKKLKDEGLISYSRTTFIVQTDALLKLSR